VGDSSGPNNWNQKIIEEFHANAGKVGGYFEGAHMILIHHIGARSGRERVNPLTYLPDGDDGRGAQRTVAPAHRAASGVRRVRDQDITRLSDVQADTALVAGQIIVGVAPRGCVLGGNERRRVPRSLTQASSTSLMH
jgi:hypothetical protein